MSAPVVVAELPPIAAVDQLSAFMEETTLPASAQLVLDAATSTVRRYCGWHVFPLIENDQMTIDARGGHLLALPTLQLVELAAVSVKERAVTTWRDLDESEVELLDYSADGWVRSARLWPQRPRSVRVTISHGFAYAPEVQQVVLTMAARALIAPTGAVSQAVGAVSLNLGAGGEGGPGGGVRLWNDQKQMLDRYRLFGRA